MKHLLLASLFAIWSSAALAHSPLKMSTPADQAILAEEPTEIALTYKGKIRLTRVRMRHAEGDVDLDLSGLKGFVSDATLPAHSFGAGDYVIEWRGLGSDGHAMKGSFSFRVKK